MKALYNVGFNWDIGLIPFFKEMNEKHKEHSQIVSVYGSIQTDYARSARSGSRIPNIEWYDFHKTCELLHNAGIKINYTLNASCLGDLSLITKHGGGLQKELDIIADSVDIITTAHPLMLDFVLQNGLDVDIEISTILNVNTIGHFYWYSKIPQVKKICLAIERNRDIGFLQVLADAIDNRDDVDLPECELIVNEFCNVGGVSCEGIYRQSCYQCHSHNVSNIDETNKYPMSRCVFSRNAAPESWLKARFILPQWIKDYMHLGINNFKITGRTHPSTYIRRVTEGYMSRQWDDNLLGLWAQLETIWKGFGEQEKAVGTFPYNKISCDDPLIDGLIDHWLQRPDFRCSDHCFNDCNFCGNRFDGIVKAVEKEGQQ